MSSRYTLHRLKVICRQGGAIGELAADYVQWREDYNRRLERLKDAYTKQLTKLREARTTLRKRASAAEERADQAEKDARNIVMELSRARQEIAALKSKGAK